MALFCVSPPKKLTMAPTVARSAEKIATCWPRPGLCPSCSTACSCAPWTWMPCPDMFSLLAADVMFQLLDGEILVRDDVAHDVADRHHPDDAALIHHRQVANAFLAHERHAVARLRSRAHDDHVR